MASNVVIAGGGFAGATCARRLETLLPKQSARLQLVNDVNFMLYTPFLPEAAAGLLEPRHVVTPLREILDRTYLRLGRGLRPRPGARTVELRTHEGESEELRYDQLVISVGSVSRTLPVPGLDRHAIGFKSLADAIWLRNHVIESLELANSTEDPERARAAAHLRLRRRRLRRASRRWPSCRTSPPTRWTAIRAPACTGCAGSWSRRPTGCCPRSTASSPTTRWPSCAGRGIEVRLGTTLDEVDG